MFLIQGILVSDALIEEQFVCSLEHCKGACCWLGDYGAPLEADEISILSDILPDIEPYLEQEGIDRIKEVGVTQYYAKPNFQGTTLRHDGACVFLHIGENGIAQCGIEKAWEEGITDLKKPMSCHLYPVRVRRVPEMNFEALNYDNWSICKDACKLGKSLKVPLYVFVREAIERQFGEDFWRELHEVAIDISSKSGHEETGING